VIIHRYAENGGNKMINFIVVDDVDKLAKTVESQITKAMMSRQIEYKIHTFNDYDKKFMEIVKKNLSNKIYFLDIETESASGIDIARMIRKNDVDSVIIFVTAHDELSGVIAKEQFMVLTFICKFDDFEKKIKEATLKALQVLGKKSIIRFQDNGSLYTLPISDILYITRDSVERKVLIKTDYTTYKVNKTLAEMKEMAGGTLMQTHRACLINPDRVRKIDKKNGVILFDTGEMTDLLSGSYKKELV